MAVKIRTRLFLVVAALVGVSIVVSALLSRLVTLVEVREVVTREMKSEPAPMLDRIAQAVQSRDRAELTDGLAAMEAATAHPIAAFDDAGRLIAASNTELAAARVQEWAPDGTFRAEILRGGVQAAVVIRGAPTRRASTRDGHALWLLLLPDVADGPIERPAPRIPLWAWTTLATSVVAVPLVFAASRRILRPVTSLTAAVARMHHGALDVRVPVHGRDELADLGRAFNEMASRLAEQERIRQQMVSDVAHELRSPVTNLRCTLEAIQDGLAVADAAAIAALHEETLFLQRMIADLEDLASAEAGQLTLRTEAVDVNALVRRATGPMASQPGGATIVLALSDDLPPVTGDAKRLEQVVRNLVANARTHTPSGGTITLTTVRDGHWVRLEVTDTGAGVSPEHLPHIFDRFYRADSSRSRATGGAGLGLTIARQFVSAHSGTIEAASAGAGQGATFTVRLPTSSLQ